MDISEKHGAHGYKEKGVERETEATNRRIMAKKRNHKSSMKIKKEKAKSRKTWTFNPSTRVEPDNKKYNRRKAKREARKDIQCWK